MSDDLAPSVETCTLTTDDGVELRAERSVPTEVRAAAVLCHPHPLYGGSMDANVVERLFRTLPARGVATLRFNFRGANGSGGTHDEGRAERLDVAAAVEAAVAAWGRGPLLMAGYSFGADVSLAVDHPAIDAWLAVAPPLRLVPRDELVALDDPRPTRLVVAAHDQFRSPAEAADLVEAATNTTMTEAAGADHFFLVGLDTVADEAAALIDRLHPPA